MTALLGSGPRRAWMELIALLVEAADRGATQAGDDQAIHSVALGAQIVASTALDLLPPDLDTELDEIQLDPALATASVPALIRAAEQTARRHPVDEFPPGASRVIVALGDLVSEVAP